MPKLTEARIIEDISEVNGIAKNQASDTCESGEEVLVSDFGKLCVKEKGVRWSLSPAIDKRMKLPARRVVTFKYSQNLRDRVNKG